MNARAVLGLVCRDFSYRIRRRLFFASLRDLERAGDVVAYGRCCPLGPADRDLWYFLKYKKTRSVERAGVVLRGIARRPPADPVIGGDGKGRQ
jgi:hypothetical protein